MPEWKSTACILCECNCGIEVQLGGPDGRSLVRVRGDDAHPSSKGYACEKPSRLDFYQNGPHRLTKPLRRRADGTFEEIDWDTAIREVAAALRRDPRRARRRVDLLLRRRRPGEPSARRLRPRDARGARLRYRSSALAQEKTGEFWVADKMVGGYTRADFEHCEVALFIGKNPWFSHCIPRARVTLREIANDPKRCLIVIDPRRTETAEIADVHLQVKPGSDALLLAALVGVLVQEDLLARDWLAAHADGLERGAAALRRSSPWPTTAAKSGVPEELVRDDRAADRRGREHGHLRGPGRADEPALDAGLVPAQAARAPHRQLRQEGRRLPADGFVPLAALASGGDGGRRARR